MKKTKLFISAVALILVMSMLSGICAFAAATTTYKLVVNASNGKVQITVDGAVKHEGGTASLNVNAGSEVTVNVVNGSGTFLFLTDSVGNTCTEETSYTFTMRGPQTYTAWFEETSGSEIIYRNTNTTEQILASATLSSSANFTAHLADVAYNYGYEFEGWNLTVEEIKAKIAAGENPIFVTPTYKSPENSFSLTVVGGTIAETGTTSATLPFMTEATLVADSAPEGQVFTAWKNSEGKVVSTKPTLRVQVFSNETYTAEYAASPVVYPTEISLSMAPAENNKVFAYTQFYVESGMTLESYGLLYVKNNTYDMADMTLENVDGALLKMVSYTTPGGVLINTFIDCESVYARAFIIYSDGSTSYTVYSDAQFIQPSADDYADDIFSDVPFISETGDDVVDDFFYDGAPWSPAYSAASSTYKTPNGAKIATFSDKNVSYFTAACDYYLSVGYELYSQGINTETFRSATFVKGAFLAHVYWSASDNDLKVVTSITEGATLPVATPAVTTGSVTTSVTQLTAKYGYKNSNANASFNSVGSGNGMGYIIQLADGSFVIYDGGYDDDAREIWETLKSLNGNKTSGIVIRGWLVTHGHGDHYPAFNQFVNDYKNTYGVKIESLIVAPVDITISSGSAHIEKKLVPAATAANIPVCYAHTGMVFTFCNVKMEILYAPEEVFMDGDPKTTHDFYTNVYEAGKDSNGNSIWRNNDSDLLASGNDNETSIVSRIIMTGGKKMMFTGDAGIAASDKLIELYGSYLKSDMCQVSHHACESFGIDAYKLINASIWFYPCSQTLYNSNKSNRNSAVLTELAKLGTKHIVRTTYEKVYTEATETKAGNVTVTANSNNKQNF